MMEREIDSPSGEMKERHTLHVAATMRVCHELHGTRCTSRLTVFTTVRALTTATTTRTRLVCLHRRRRTSCSVSRQLPVSRMTCLSCRLRRRSRLINFATILLHWNFHHVHHVIVTLSILECKRVFDVKLSRRAYVNRAVNPSLANGLACYVRSGSSLTSRRIREKDEVLSARLLDERRRNVEAALVKPHRHLSRFVDVQSHALKPHAARRLAGKGVVC